MPYLNHLNFRLIRSAIAWQVLLTVVALVPNGAEAQHRLSEDCPRTFSIVDIGTWQSDDKGNLARFPGGTLIDIGQQDKTQPDAETAWVTCYPLGHSSEPATDQDGMPIPLVSHVVLPTLLGFTQYPTAEYAADSIDTHFQSHLPEVAVSEVNFGNGRGRGLCKLGQEYEQRTVFRDYACLISMDLNGKAELLFYCRARPHDCGYYLSLGEGVMVYQQPWDYPFTRMAKTLDDAAEAWIEFAATGHSYIEERRVARE